MANVGCMSKMRAIVKRPHSEASRNDIVPLLYLLSNDIRRHLSALTPEVVRSSYLDTKFGASLCLSPCFVLEVS